MESIVEQIIEKIEDTNKTIKDIELFNYVDKYIDEWNIDIGDYYLDDIIENVSHIIKKRKKLNINNYKDDDIVFKLDDETLEKNQLETVIKHYDKLYTKACKINTEDIISSSIDSDNSIDIYNHSSSWNNTLNRIENIYKKVNNTN